MPPVGHNAAALPWHAPVPVNALAVPLIPCVYCALSLFIVHCTWMHLLFEHIFYFLIYFIFCHRHLALAFCTLPVLRNNIHTVWHILNRVTVALFQGNRWQRLFIPSTTVDGGWSPVAETGSAYPVTRVTHCSFASPGPTQSTYGPRTIWSLLKLANVCCAWRAECFIHKLNQPFFPSFLGSFFPPQTLI